MAKALERQFSQPKTRYPRVSRREIEFLAGLDIGVQVEDLRGLRHNRLPNYAVLNVTYPGNLPNIRAVGVAGR